MPKNTRHRRALSVLALLLLLFFVWWAQRPSPPPRPGVTSAVTQTAVVTASPSASADATVAQPVTPHVHARMTTPRVWHAAVLLADGRVLVAGGRAAKTSAIAGAELYDPATNEWKATSPMARPRVLHSMVRLHDGRVLVAGGSTDAGTLAEAELYDPATQSWTATGSMAQARLTAAAVVLGDGRVLVAGGQLDNVVLDRAEIYDPAAGTWSDGGSLSVGRAQLEGLRLDDGRVLFVGGLSFPGGHARPLGDADLFDPQTNRWSRAAALQTPRYNHVLARLPGGGALVAGGYDGAAATATSERFDPESGMWSPAAPLPRPWTLATAFSARLLDEDLLVAGGWSKNVDAATARFDRATGTWSDVERLERARTAHTLTALADGVVLAAGGNDGSGGDPVAESELFDPADGRWSALPPAATERPPDK